MMNKTFKNIREKMRNKQGFTLVELIVVIVIILILAALLIPNVMRYITNARVSTVKNDAATILTECQAELADAAANDQTVDENTYTYAGNGEVEYTLSTTTGEEYVVATLTYTAANDYVATYTAGNANQWVVENPDGTQVYPAQ